MKRIYYISIVVASALGLGLGLVVIITEHTVVNSNKFYQHLFNDTIEYYGKAIDQYGNPVGGAQAIAYVTTYDGMWRSHSNYYYTNTAADGTFSFSNFSGGSLSIGLRKEGYDYGGHQPSKFANVTYDHAADREQYKPEPNNPVVLVMWKLHGYEALNKFYVSIHLFDEKLKTVIDFSQQKENGDEADVALTFIPDPLKRYNLDSLKIYTANGDGFQLVNSIYENQAPKNGYINEIIAKDGDLKYFVKLRKGRIYGVITISTSFFESPSRSCRLTIDGVINPTGSRNLEVPPVIKPAY